MNGDGRMIGWDGTFESGKRPAGIHPTASVGGPPESRTWMVGDVVYAPEIASSALVHAFCTIDGGTQRPTRVGERSFLQARVHLGHDAVIGDDAEICAGVVIGGWVEIGDGVRIGGNSWVKPRIKIGEGAILGGGSVVTKDIPPHEVWCGNPAKYLKLAWTHPDYIAFEQLRHVKAIRFPSEAEILDHLYGQGTAAGHGHGVAGDYA